MTKRRILVLVLGLVTLLVFAVVFSQPFVVHRIATKAFTGYELYRLKYPNSQLIETEIRATSKVTMATDYNFYSSDDVDTVLEYLEVRRPGFIQLQGSHVIIEPTFRNTTCANETMFRDVFQLLEKGTPCIEVSIHPALGGGTSIRLSENWSSMGFPAWLRGL